MRIRGHNCSHAHKIVTIRLTENYCLIFNVVNIFHSLLPAGSSDNRFITSARCGTDIALIGAELGLKVERLNRRF